MNEASHVGLSYSSEGLVSLATSLSSSSSSTSRTQEYTDLTRQSNEDQISGQNEDDEEVYVGSLDKFLSFSSKRQVRKLTWQRSLFELDKNLQKICGPSPQSADQVSHSLSNSPVSLYNNCSLSRANSVFNDTSKERKDLKCNSGAVDDDSFNGNASPLQFPSSPPNTNMDKLTTHSSRKLSFLRRADSMWESTFQKFLPVRHIETHSKLHNELLKITGGDKAKTNPLSAFDKNDKCSSPGLIRDGEKVEITKSFESSCIGGCIGNFKTNFQRLDVEDSTVQVDKNCNEIEVGCHQIFERSLDAKSQKFLLDQKIDHNCICLLNEIGEIRICKGSKEVIEINYQVPYGHFYLPVIKGDELQNGDYMISFHVPEDLNYEDISVKTVDDRLYVSGQKRRYSANYGNHPNHKNSGFFSRSVDTSNNAFPIIGKNIMRKTSDSNENQLFHAVLRFPGTVDTRSVSSYLNHHHLVIVKTSGINSQQRVTN